MERVSQLHLIRLGGSDGFGYVPIQENEWRAAVELTPGVRIAADGVLAPNLKTGDATTLRHQQPCVGEVSISESQSDAWEPLFSWQASGSVVANHSFDTADPTCPRTQALFSLAEALQAAVVDDTGQHLRAPGGPKLH